ncbi:hypothetical protein B0T26DRAFT_751546 [Lasiosphaeria miniovina]|uniref:Uncharacterized protein n=1 Tax=Lasiosphaeria miniovina TaxID=1954250 RepID=A0AA40AKG0_9PEZI|nr:uncharacterized protein B0T26DRAFT_751546 [Lasiosphaeria miniovina]KAK0717497.1 hypothetical protein B0T26DRAFT_751546 [Lasiosphaeria miniovina]
MMLIDKQGLGALLGFLAFASPSLAGYNCGSSVVITGATPCTFCPAPTCTNLEVGTLPCSCQGVATPTFTQQAVPCQSWGPCNTLSCATVVATWTQPCPTTLATTISVPRGGCRTFFDTVTASPATGCPPAPACSTPYCLAATTETVDCACTHDVYSTRTVPCPTNCASVPCPLSTLDFVYTNC